SHRQKVREQIPAGGVVAAFEQFRHGVEVGSHVIRKEDPDQQGIHDPGVPSKGGDYDAARIRSSHLSDEVLRAQIGGHHGSADDVPGQPTVRHEVTLRGLVALAAGIKSHRHGDGEINNDNDDIDRAEGHAAGEFMHGKGSLRRDSLCDFLCRLGGSYAFGPAVFYMALHPPSTASTVPVIYAAASEARKTAAPPISCGWPT